MTSPTNIKIINTTTTAALLASSQGPAGTFRASEEPPEQPCQGRRGKQGEVAQYSYLLDYRIDPILFYTCGQQGN